MLGSFDILGWFNFISTAGTKDIIVSLPLFCQISGASISELDFEKYLIRLKPEKSFRNQSHMDFIFNELAKTIEKDEAMVGNEEETYKNYFYFEHF